MLDFGWKSSGPAPKTSPGPKSRGLNSNQTGLWVEGLFSLKEILIFSIYCKLKYDQIIRFSKKVILPKLLTVNTQSTYGTQPNSRKLKFPGEGTSYRWRHSLVVSFLMSKTSSSKSRCINNLVYLLPLAGPRFIGLCWPPCRHITRWRVLRQSMNL